MDDVELRIDRKKLDAVTTGNGMLWSDPHLLLEWAIYKAITEGASDIHLDKHDHQIRIRLAVDGTCRMLHIGPEDFMERITVILKGLCDLDISEKRIIQEGRFSVRTGTNFADIRMAAIPSVEEYQDITLRIIDQKMQHISLPKLGFSTEQLEKIHRSLSRSNGMILMTGPTGCGKTTLVYAMLQKLNNPEKKIQTIEDPVEIKMEGICQSQVNMERGLTFPLLLRSILRTAPNIIMVGEIRDAETAHVAISAANSGHLVLSTMHTNSSAATVARLQDFQVPSYLIAPSLSLIISQRLTRRLCPCRKATPITPQIAQIFNDNLIAIPPETKHIFTRGGCDKCNQTGYTGRFLITEMLEVHSSIRDLIHQGASQRALLEAAFQYGFTTLFQEGLKHVLAGDTSLEEVYSYMQLT